MSSVLKKVLLVIVCIVLFLLLCLVGCYFYYERSIHYISGNSDEVVHVVVESGESSKEIIDELYDASFIKNKTIGYVYLKLHSDILLQAGDYELNRGMNFEEVVKAISQGKVIDDSISVTFVEGKRLSYFVSQIANNFAYTEEEIYDVIQSRDFLDKAIDKYWFLTDVVLNDKLYYALEGYLYPNTYQLKQDATIEDILYKLLDGMKQYLSSYKEEFESKGISVHEVLTMASIVELEGANSDDRKGVAGVFYNRLAAGWSLGSDVTTYYASRIDMAQRDLYQNEIDAVNDYNTRSSALAGKLPVGPICNPGHDAILASLEPEEHEYYYFVADKNKKTYFSKTQNEFLETIADLKSKNLWYEY